jgi:hypothetical protein
VNTSDILARVSVPDPAPESSAVPEVPVELTEEQVAELAHVPTQQDPASSSAPEEHVKLTEEATAELGDSSAQ